MNKAGQRWLTLALWVIFALMTLIPIGWMFLVSVKRRADLFGKPSFLVDFSRITWDNYVTVISNPAFQKYMINSLIVSTSNAALVCVLGLQRESRQIRMDDRLIARELVDVYEPRADVIAASKVKANWCNRCLHPSKVIGSS